MRPRRRGRLLVVAAVAGLAAACSGVPDASTARVVSAIPGNARPPERLGLPYAVVEPRKGDEPRDVVEKYLRAQADPERAHGDARQFLTPGAADRWDDQASVEVIEPQPYEGSVSPTNRVSVQGTRVGTVSTAGSYTSDPGAFTWDFHLVKVAGDWRIDNPPPGVVVSSSDFASFYGQYALYYLDPAERKVVPDLRYFAATSTATATSRATQFLRLLQQPPSPALARAVHSELTNGVRLSANVVQNDDKVLQVYMTGLGAKDAAARGAAAAQIVWTLSPLANSGVEIFDDAQPLVLSNVTQPTQQGDWESFDPDALPVGTGGYFLRDGAVYSMDGRRIPGPAGDGRYDLTSCAVSVADVPDTLRLAGVSTSGGRARLHVGALEGALDTRLEARTLTRPTWDGTSDEVWTVRDGSGIVRIPRRGPPAPVDSQSLQALGTVHDLVLSRDGTRVAIVAGDQGRLYVGRVTRSTSGVAVTDPQLVALPLPQVYSVSWQGATSLLAVARDQGDDRVLETVSVDGAQVKAMTKAGLGGPPVAAATAPNLAPVVQASDGTLWQLAGDRWTNLVRGSTVPGYSPVYP